MESYFASPLHYRIEENVADRVFPIFSVKNIQFSKRHDFFWFFRDFFLVFTQKVSKIIL